MNFDEEYLKRLEAIIKQMLSPLKGLPFNLIINSISGYDVLPFDNENKNHSLLINNLKKSIEVASEEINREGIKSTRANEIGNYIEPYLKEALNKIKNYSASTPTNSKGKKVSSGYPDIQLEYENETCYVECKTYNIKNIATTQRSFYLSPSETFKITKSGLHFIISFEVLEIKRETEKNIYKVNSWKILDAYHLDCDVKYEFNSDNRRMYNPKMILAEGIVK